MQKYLKSLPQLRGAVNGYTVVSGNQAADMDSCCSAIVAAYLETAKGRQCVPLIQIPQRHLALRKDIEFVFNQLEIDPDWLFYADTIPVTDLTPLFIVDHNAATLKGRVASVIDHHELEPGSATTQPGVDPNILVKCGSCMSAVINHYAASLPQAAALFEHDEVLAPLALYPILMDTTNLTSKVEDIDRNAVKFLSQFKTTISPFDSMAVVRSEKNNVDGLSPSDMLRKDYKEWGPIGISSLPKVFEKLGCDSYALGSAMLKHKRDAGLDVMVAVASGKRKGQYQRQLAIAAPRDFDVAAACPNLELKLVSDEEDVRFYDQKNTSASRKQVAPQIRKAWDDFTAQHS